VFALAIVAAVVAVVFDAAAAVSSHSPFGEGWVLCRCTAVGAADVVVDVARDGGMDVHAGSSIVADELGAVDVVEEGTLRKGGREVSAYECSGCGWGMRLLGECWGPAPLENRMLLAARERRRGWRRLC
jgi:hypothetical protein